MRLRRYTLETRLLRSARLLAALMLVRFAMAAGAQAPPSNSAVIQREAMRKLAFLAGHWSGPATIFQGPEPLHLTQTEEVAYKLDGLVLLVEGHSMDADGKARFSALATIAYDDAAKSYRFRAYHDGRYLDTELTVVENGFSWGFEAGPAHILNAMQMTPKGEWQETTSVTMGNGAPHPSVDMLLHREN